MPSMSAYYKAALDALLNNPDVLLDLNKDIFFGTTPMEHLQLLLKFMNYEPNKDVDILPHNRIELPEEPRVQTKPTSHGFFADFWGSRPLENIRDSFTVNTGMSVTPFAYSYLQRNHVSDLFCSNNSKVYGSTNDPRLGIPDHRKRETVERKLEVKSDDLRDSTTFPGWTNTNEGNARFVHPSLDVNGIRTEPPVSYIYNGCFDRISNTKVRKLPATHLHMRRNLLYNDGAKNRLQTTYIKQNEESASKICFSKRLCKTQNKIEYKPYTCITCNKKFKQKCHLNRHQRMHTGVKRFFCLTCDHGFYQRSNLRAHVRTHSRDNTISHVFSCCLCTKRYTRKHSLMKHLARHSNGLIGISKD